MKYRAVIDDRNDNLTVIRFRAESEDRAIDITRAAATRVLREMGESYVLYDISSRDGWDYAGVLKAS